MPAPYVPLAALRATVRAVEKALRAGHAPAGFPSSGGVGAIAAAGDAMGLSSRAVYNRLGVAKRLHKLEPDWKLYKPPARKTAPKGSAPEGPDPSELRLQRLRDRVAQLEREANALRRQANYDDDIRKAIFGLAAVDPTPPAWVATPRKPVAGRVEVPILFTSDFQWGEVVRAAELDGRNAYDVAIATRRYRFLIEKACHLARDILVGAKYPGIVLFRGGDAVSGDIHAELRETNELASIPAVMSLADEEIRGIEVLAETFGRVWVISIPGNHGRTTVKPVSKNYVGLNYELVLADILERHFKAKNDSRVTFWTPRSGDALFELFGRRFLLTHGDRIGSRGGQGFIGPIATIVRGIDKVRRQYARFGTIVDRVFVGHFHTTAEPPHGFSNGSLVGFNEYARDLRADPEPPQQWMVFVHPKWGIASRWPILVEPPESRAYETAVKLGAS